MSQDCYHRRVRRAACAALALSAILLVSTELNAWGESGHRMIGLAAAHSLPDDMPAFFRRAARTLSYLNPEPDRWRDRGERDKDAALDGAASPDHFMDLELIPAERLASALAAPNRWAFIDTLHKLRLDPVAVGLLPWRIVEMTPTVRVEFRLWRAATEPAMRRMIEARIINDAGILGHYVADGSNPTHMSIHYNGWSGANPNGYATDKRLHGRFESDFVDARLRIQDITPLIDRQASVSADFRAATIAYLKQSNALVERLYQLDKAAPFGAGNAVGENKAFTAERLAAAAQMLRDLWYSAYVTSGG